MLKKGIFEAFLWDFMLTKYILDKTTYVKNQAFIEMLLAYFTSSDLFGGAGKKTKIVLI